MAVVEIGVDGAESLLLQLLLDESLFKLAIVISCGAHCDICPTVISLFNKPGARLPSHDTEIVRLDSFTAEGAPVREEEKYPILVTVLFVEAARENTPDLESVAVPNQA